MKQVESAQFCTAEAGVSVPEVSRLSAKRATVAPARQPAKLNSGTETPASGR
jgi:hypothetical protein